MPAKRPTVHGVLRNAPVVALAVGTVLALVGAGLYFPTDGANVSLAVPAILFVWMLAPFGLVALLAGAWSESGAKGVLAAMVVPGVALIVWVLASSEPFLLVYLWLLPVLQLGIVLAARLAARVTRRTA